MSAKTVVIIYLILLLCAFMLKLPSNDRDWNADQIILASASFEGEMVHLQNVRNISYRTTSDFDIEYYDRSFNVSEIESMWFMIEHFGEFDGLAHALFSFGFSDGSFVAISPEIRKENGEKFSVVKGMMREFELMYVIADEEDVIKLRTNYRNDTVYLYPLDATQEFMQQVFVDMALKTDGLNDDPEFYNTVTNSCSMSLLKHVNEFYPAGVSVNAQVLLPGYSDAMLYEKGFILTNLSFEDARQKYMITEKAQKHGDLPGFSKAIRN